MRYLYLVICCLVFSCQTAPQKSEREKRIDRTKEIVLKAYNAEITGDTALWRSLLSEDYTFTLTGQLDISKTYTLDEFLVFMEYFGSILKGKPETAFQSVLVGENEAMLFLKGKMEGVGGKYENDYAVKYTLNENGQIVQQKEWLSDILLVTQLYGQEICGDKKTL